VRNTILIALASFVFCSIGLGSRVQHLPSDPSWNKPVQPFRIAGNLYYVGASDVTSYLITTSQGHILLDGGLPETAPLIERSIATLGFKLKDVKILINSHPHFDHAGGLAELKRLSGARMIESRRDTPILETGDKDDFTWGNTAEFPPVKVDESIDDGHMVTFHGVSLTAHVTPGHTKGCTTWSMPLADGGKTYNVVFVCSVSAPGYKLINNPKYPDIVHDFEHSFAVLRALPCDIFLASHGSMFDLTAKIKSRKTGVSNPFINPAEYRAYIDESEQSFKAKLAKQQAASRSSR
jgi:metallo-beta-lactamase class B